MNRATTFHCAIGFLIGCSMAGLSVAAEPRNADNEVDSRIRPVANLLKISDRIFCGGEPGSDKAFAYLAEKGIKTVASVDGGRPDVQLAEKYGLQYVHIPIGYDGVDPHAAGSLARLVRDADSPIYIHCHHGHHRGPVAAAIAGMASGAIDHVEANRLLQQAGTSRDYAGLWRAVETYRVPPSDAQLPPLVPVATVDSFVAAMANVDRAFDHLKMCRVANWSTPADHPDLDPHQQVVLLREGFRESRRHQSSADTRMRQWLAEAERMTQKLEKALLGGDHDMAGRQMTSLGQSCVRCHQRFRN
ncbi:MAG: hypothetical protein AAGA03_02970 [Planctomycetota bacterium]